MQRFDFDLDDLNPLAVLGALDQGTPCFFFDSNDHRHPDAQSSMLYWDPIDALILKDTPESFDRLRGFQQQHAGCAFAGVLSYDLARQMERLPKQTPPTQTPDICVYAFDQSLRWDHQTGRIVYSALAENKDEAQKRYNNIRNVSDLKFKHQKIHFSAETEKSQHIENIQKTIDYIVAGDIFQACITQRFLAKAGDDFDPIAAYKQLCETNPAPFSAYVDLGEYALLSSSPERFLSCSAQGRVETKPIKGTLPDTQDPAKLQASEKDRAENIMIVDLLRNDISKVCTPDSVQVEKLCAIESFAGLHHLVSTVSGQLQGDKNSIDLLEACFPGGSISGAPKIRAMEIIEELEPVRRGFYCGTLFHIDFDGNMDSNILIRTLVHDRNTNEIHVHSGGGIVADSDPEAEYEESLVKARKIFEAFG